MKNQRDIIVLDTKYKKMNFNYVKGNGVDVDRNDFFQINTYMSYYQNQNFNVKIGGLLYPIEKSFKENKDICHSQTWFGNTNTKFIIDGIDLSDLKEAEDNENKFSQLSKKEQEFIDRIKKFL